MKITLLTCLLAPLLSWAAVDNAALPTQLPQKGPIVLPGTHSGHLQDICREGPYIYWMQTRVLFKTDLTGHVLASKNVEGHHAGCEIRNGKLYVAVCPMQNKTGGKTLADTRLQVNVYDPVDLKLLEEHVLPINDRAGSFCFLEDGTCLVGCLRHSELRPDQVLFHHLDPNFKLIKSHVLDNVTVRLGIEVIRRRGDYFYLFLYKGKGLVIKLDKTFKEVARFDGVPGTLGIFWDGSNCWVGASKRDAKTKRHTSTLVCRPDFDPQ